MWCHSNLERIELFLNGESLGSRQMARNSHVRWSVPYAPGVLEARGYRGAAMVLAAKRETTGDPARIMLSPVRARMAADGEDATVIEVSVVDAAGRVVPTASDQVRFRVTGSGRLIGVGNGDPSSHEADKGDSRRVFNGLAVAIVQGSKADGEIRVEATSPSLESGIAVVSCDRARPRPAVP